MRQIVKTFCTSGMSLSDKKGDAKGDQNVDAHHDAKSASTKKQHLATQAPQSQQDQLLIISVVMNYNCILCN